MKKEIWQEDQPVLRDDLVLAQSSKEEAISERLLDTFGYGIVGSSQLLAELTPFAITVVTLPYSVNIGTGVAYDPTGERILIDSTLIYNSALPATTTDNGIGGTTLTPQSSGSISVPLTSGKVNYIYVSYLQVVDPTDFSLKETTNERLFTKGKDGYKIEVVIDNGPSVGNPDLFKPNVNAVFLGVVDIAQVLTVSQRAPFNLKAPNLNAVVPDPLTTLNALSKPYASGQQVSYAEHVEAVGTGLVTPVNPHGLAISDLTGSFAGKTAELHEKLFHESGISGVQTSITSALYGEAVDSAGAPIAPTFARDNFVIKKLLSTEAVQVNGITVSNADISQDYLFYFVDSVGNFLDNGIYTIYLDSLTKTLKLAANGSPTNTSYRVYGITSGTFTNSNTVPIASVIASASNFLLWEVDWDSTGLGLGNDNFITITDKRFFGTIGSNSLRRDVQTDTFVVGHNLLITGDNNIVPAGVTLPFAGPVSNIPAFYLYCDGQIYNKATYPRLFNAIGYAWGGDGVNFFRVPDGRGGFLRGIADVPAVTFTAAITDVITTSSAHQYNRSGIPVQLTTTGTLPAPLSTGTTYWVIWLSANTLNLAASHADAIAGTPIVDITTIGTGVHTLSQWLDPEYSSREASAPGGSASAVGTEQPPATGPHQHYFNNPSNNNNFQAASSGAFASTFVNATFGGIDIGPETRPYNIGMCFIIKY